MSDIFKELMGNITILFEAQFVHEWNRTISSDILHQLREMIIHQKFYNNIFLINYYFNY